MRYSFKEEFVGKYKKFVLEDTVEGYKVEGLFLGATTLSFYVPFNGSLFNVLDGFQDEDEITNSRGARGWIMTPFPNRIPEGNYSFNNKEYKIHPLPPRTQVIHGFTSQSEFRLKKIVNSEDSIEIVLLNENLRKNNFAGYPFDVNVYISYKLTGNKFEITVNAENIGNDTAPFYCGWHPYFKTPQKGIENLILEINAESIIQMDKDLIPLQGEAAYKNIVPAEPLNFNKKVPAESRIINNKIIDVCYANLKKNEDQMFSTSLIDTENNMHVTMFQERGVTLMFTGDSLLKRKRESIAMEPMECLTNSFNRPEFNELISIHPASEKKFTFGVEVKPYK